MYSTTFTVTADDDGTRREAEMTKFCDDTVRYHKTGILTVMSK